MQKASSHPVHSIPSIVVDVLEAAGFRAVSGLTQRAQRTQRAQSFLSLFSRQFTVTHSLTRTLNHFLLCGLCVLCELCVNLQASLTPIVLFRTKAQSGPGSYTLYAIGCRYCFTPLTGVLFTFPSRYWFTIGRQGVFSLIQWSGRIHAEFHVHRITWDASRGDFNFTHPAVTVSGRFFHIVTFVVISPISRSLNPGRTSPPGLGCSAFARHY